MGENRGVRQATEMHAASLTLTLVVAELRDRLCRGQGCSLPNLPSAETPVRPCHRLQKLVASLWCLSCLKTLGSCRLGTNLPCMCWVVQWSHVTALNPPSKGDFLILFKFCPYFASLQPPGPEVQLLFILRLYSWLFLQFLDAVIPNSQSHIAAIYWMLRNVNRNTLYPYTQTTPCRNYVWEQLWNQCCKRKLKMCSLTQSFCRILYKC